VSSSVSGSTTGFAQPPYIKQYRYRPVVMTYMVFLVIIVIAVIMVIVVILVILMKIMKGLILNLYESKLIFQ
jgi:hypothetical protein